MNQYVAMLRGIMPANPQMRNEKLRGVFEALGFGDVQTVISSGNVLFTDASEDAAALEARIEEALPRLLGFSSTTIIRSRQEWQALVDRRPFEGVEQGPNINTNVTFLKQAVKPAWEYPCQPKGPGFTLIGGTDREIYSVVDLGVTKTPDMMTWFDKQFAKANTTRTYKTVERILAKMR